MSATTANTLPSNTMSRLPKWVNTLLVVAIGWSLAVLTLKLLPLPEPSATENNVAAPIAGRNNATPDTMQQALQIAKTHIFGDIAVAPVKKAEPVKQAVVEPTRLNLQLAGVFAYTPQEKAIAIISAGSAEQTAYSVGDKVSGETTLKAVYNDHVILNNRGRDEKLMLPADSQPIAMRPIETAPNVDNSNANQGNNYNDGSDITLPTNPGELRDTLARNPSILGRIVAAEPYQENGKLLGYRITPKQNPEILEAQGIVAGDVITSVNNIELNSQKQGIRALRNAVKAQSLDVMVLRDGIQVPLTISLSQ